MHIDPSDFQCAGNVILAEIKEIHLRGILRGNEIEPFANEVFARLLAVWTSYDAARETREGFINTVVANVIASLLRERYARKRRGMT